MKRYVYQILLQIVTPIMALGAINIESFEVTGSNSATLTWTNSVSTGYYRVAWCSDLVLSNWSSSWSSLQQFGGTSNQTITVDLPGYYRMIHSNSEFAVETNHPIDAAAETWYPLNAYGRAAIENLEPGAQYAVDWHNGTEWVRGWQELCNIAATGLQMTANVPVSFRLAVLSTNPPAPATNEVYVFGGTYEYGADGRGVAVDGFYVSVAEVTESEWQHVYSWAATNGYDFTAGGLADQFYTNYPVVSVSWFDACKWLNAKSEMDSLTPCYTRTGSVYRTGEYEPVCAWTNSGYRLPTEAEWERAARGFITGGYFPWGGTNVNDIGGQDANYRNSGDLSEVMPRLLTPVKGWSYQPDRYSELLSNMLPSDELFRLQTYNIYPYPPNDYGLYDMAGNAAEWCWDWYTHAGPPAGSTNSTGPASGTRRVIRGGHCLSNTDRVTVYRRSFAKPDKVSDIVGFRYVRRRM